MRKEVLFFGAMFFVCYNNIASTDGININKDVKVIVGKPLKADKQEELYKLTKERIERDEGWSARPYQLKGEYYIDENKNKRPLYTICYGNTMYFDNLGNFMGYVKKGDTKQKWECDEMFSIQYEYYNKLLYIAMTDRTGTNYYNKMTINETATMINLVWWMGKRGSIYITSAMINYVKYNRTKAGEARLKRAINKYYKKCSKHHEKGCKNRKNNILKDLKLL